MDYDLLEQYAGYDNIDAIEHSIWNLCRGATV